MKSERRHELEQNTLAQWLAETIEKVKPYTNAILGGTLAVFVVLVVFSWWSGHAEGQAAKAWDAYNAVVFGQDQATMVADFEKVAKQYPDSLAGDWALMTVADMQLDSGCNLLFANKASANIELRNALDNYLKLVERNRSPEVAQRAILGQARTQEALGDLVKAQEGYERLLKRWPEGAYAMMAQQRLLDIQKQSTKQFADKFAQYDPKPAPSEGPGKPGVRPDFNLENLPDGTPPVKAGTSSEPKPASETEPNPAAGMDLTTLPSLTPKAAADKSPDDKAATPAPAGKADEKAGDAKK